MNRLQANLCLVCVTLCWAGEVVIYACIPDEVPEYATMGVTSLAGACLMLVPFWRRVAAAIRTGGWKFVLAMLGLAVLSAAYNYHYIAGLNFFDVVDGAFASCLTVITMPFVMLAMRRRVEPATWLSVAIVSAGILLVLLPSLRRNQTEGLVVLLVGCVLCSIATILLADFVRKHDPVAVAVVRECFFAAIAFAAWFIADKRLFAGLPVSKALASAWVSYTFFIVVLALILNLFAIRRVSAADATVIYSMQIVFTLLLGLVLPATVVEHIELTPRVLVGAGLVVAGSLAEIIDFGGKGKESQQ